MLLLDEEPPAAVYPQDLDKVCLLPRLSLSELIYISGLVRALVCSRREECDVMLLAKRDHVRPIRNLYADIPGVRFKFVADWDDLTKETTPTTTGAAAGASSLLDDIRAQGYRVVPLPSFREACPYSLLELSPALARTEFRLQRNLDEERALLDRVRREVGDVYVVVHEDEARRIRPQLLPAGVPAVRVRDPAWRTENVFDWVQVIDSAIQFHGVESCFLLMADALDLKARKYCHSYAEATTRNRPGAYRDVITIV